MTSSLSASTGLRSELDVRLPASSGPLTDAARLRRFFEYEPLPPATPSKRLEPELDGEMWLEGEALAATCSGAGGGKGC